MGFPYGGSGEESTCQWRRHKRQFQFNTWVRKILTIKKAKHWRIDAFELWYWRRLLRVPRTARIFNQSIIKETDPEYSLEELMLKLKLQYFGHLMWRTGSMENTLILEKTEGRRRRGQQRMIWTGVWVSSGSWWWTGKPGVLQSVWSQRVRHYWTTELNSFSISLSNEYSELIYLKIYWFDLLAVQETFRSLLQHHNSKASILWCSAFFTVQLSQSYMTMEKTIVLTLRIFVVRKMSLLLNTLSRFVIAFLPRSNHLQFHGCSHRL